MRASVEHSVRGRLRVRYPVDWFKTRRDTVESRLRQIPGIRTAEGRSLTGSVCIEYDPYRLAEDAIVAALGEISAELDPVSALPDVVERPPEPETRQSLPGAPLLRLIGATSVLTAACCLPLPPLAVAGLVAASGLPVFQRAGSSVAARRRLNGD